MAWGYQGSRMIKIQKKAMRILTLSKYNSHTEPLFKKSYIFKIDELLKLNEFKLYFKYMHQDLPSYLLNWKITPNIHNHNTRSTNDIYSFRTKPKHAFAKRCLRYSLPHVINNTLKIVTGKMGNHSLQGFANYAKNNLLKKYEDTCSVSNCYTCYEN